MKPGTTIALGLAGGYLLGRFRKARWLLMAAALAAGSRATGGLADKSEAGPELRTLVEQGKKVAVSVLGRQMTSATDRIRQATESLKQRAKEKGGGPGEEQPEAAAQGEKENGGEGPGPDGGEEKPPAPQGHPGQEPPQGQEKQQGRQRQQDQQARGGQRGEPGGGDGGQPEAPAGGQPQPTGPRGAGRRSGTRLSMQYRGPRRDPRADPTGRRRGTSQAWR